MSLAHSCTVTQVSGQNEHLLLSPCICLTFACENRGADENPLVAEIRIPSLTSTGCLAFLDRTRPLLRLVWTCLWGVGHFRICQFSGPDPRFCLGL